ncbi:MAG: HupE/UreJ family protein, partial [Gemmatimonadetes bacterium]|nr:HupE/UreJ family protein [Gemmatimonadota bacterium]
MAGLAAVTAALVPIVALADVGPPAHMQVTEKSPGLYAVQWRVPKALPARAVPTPLLPETCRPAGERSVVDQPGAWLLSRDWRCDVGLAGQEVGIRYPFPDLALTTVIRVDLLSGDRFAHVMSPGEGAWSVPEGTAPPDPVLGAQRAVLAGAAHAVGSWIHLAFVMVLALFGGLALPVRLVTLFAGGQLLGAILAVGLGTGLPAGPAEIGLAIAVVLLARESLRGEEERRGLAGLASAAGLVHGLGLAALLAEDLGLGAGLVSQWVAVLGMDAVHLVGVGLV